MNATVWVTNVCTLACKYCYEGKKENVSMSMDTAMATVAFMKKMMICDSKGTVRFHGGEPLMCRDIISIIIDRLESEYSDILSYGITTNALLIDNSISKWLVDHFDNISVSIDGNEGTHDQNRVLKNGKGTFLEVQRGYRKLLKHGRKICARMTVTPNTCAHLTENICFLIEEGFQIIEPVPDIRPSVWDEDSFNVLQNAYYRIVDLQKRHKDLVEIRGLRAAMNRPRNGPCDGGKTSFHISPEGSVYPCMVSVGLKQHIIGNVHNGINEEKVLAIEQLDLEPIKTCMGCARYDYCDATRCRLINLINTGSPYQPDEMTCAITNLLFNTNKYYCLGE